MSNGREDVAVVVPTHDRPERLRRCLAALECQDGGSSVEIIVVDDGSSRAQAVARVVAEAPRARLIRQECRGPAAARNTGVRGAQAPIVCFTDDDCEPAPDWVARLVAPLRAHADAVGGKTVNAEPERAFAAATQTVIDYLLERARQPPPRTSLVLSNNLACRADVLATVAFDERYKEPAGEDRDFCARLVEHGYALVLEPRAVVAHRQQLSLTDFWRQHVRYGRGAYRFRREHVSARPESWRYYGGLLRRGFQEGALTGSLVCLAELATAAGLAGEWIAQRGGRRSRYSGSSRDSPARP